MIPNARREAIDWLKGIGTLAVFVFILWGIWTAAVVGCRLTVWMGTDAVIYPGEKR